MFTRRAWLRSLVAIGALVKLKPRFLLPAPSTRPASPSPYVPTWEGLAKRHRDQPLVTISEGSPVYGFGAVDILGVSPTLLPDSQFQEANDAPFSKVRLKKSWEIKGNNMIGTTPPRTPRTWEMDFKPLRACHLIDGNPETYWCCRAQSRPDVQPQWIRIDLPYEVRIKAVVIVPRHDNQGWPEELTVKVSRDAWHWDTVYENFHFEPPAQPQRQVFSFEPRIAKQVWVVANQLRWVIDQNFLAFSVAGVEVLDDQGNNVALLSRGAGVTTSSTNQGSAGEKSLMDMLWPVHYDLGLKWVRIGYWESVLDWHYAEQEKGKIVIDPLADQTVTETAENGINIVCCLAYGNWLYSREAKERKRLQALPPYSTATKQIWVVPFEWPPPPTDSREHFQAWLRYVRTMVRHFRGRIRQWEIWNEQNANWRAYYKERSETEEAIKEYCHLVRETVPIIREEDPEAKISLGSTAGFDRDYLTGCLKLGVGRLVDVISWHPFYGARQDLPQYRNYPSEVQAWKKVCESYGFRGEYMATESGWYAPYPVPAKPFGGGAVSELVKAKCLARYFAMSLGLGLTTFWNTTWHHYIWWDLGLFRNPASADPVSPTQPQAAYYVLRNLCSLLESASPTSIKVEFSNKNRTFDSATFRFPDGAMLVALWLPEEPVDDSPRVVSDVHFPGLSFSRATGIDVFNGVTQPLKSVESRLRGLIIRDYPTFIRLDRTV